MVGDKNLDFIVERTSKRLTSRLNGIPNIIDPPENWDQIRHTLTRCVLAISRIYAYQGNCPHHGFGALIGYTPEMSDYFLGLDKDLFVGNPLSIHEPLEKVVPMLREAEKYDGIVLITAKGMAVHSGMLITKLNHEKILKELGRQYTGNLGASYGFDSGSRNVSVCAASYALGKIAPVFGLTTNGYLRVFWNGQVLCSTKPEEEKELFYKKTFLENLSERVQDLVTAFDSPVESGANPRAYKHSALEEVFGRGFAAD